MSSRSVNFLRCSWVCLQHTFASTCNWQLPFLNQQKSEMAVQMSQHMTKPTKWPVHPATTQDQSSLSVWIKLGSLATHPLNAMKTLIRLGGCPGWSESSLGAQVILLVLSCTEIISWFISWKLCGQVGDRTQDPWICCQLHYRAQQNTVTQPHKKTTFKQFQIKLLDVFDGLKKHFTF